MLADEHSGNSRRCLGGGCTPYLSTRVMFPDQKYMDAVWERRSNPSFFVLPRGCNRNTPFLLVRRSQIAVGCGPYICGLPCVASLHTGKTLQVTPVAQVAQSKRNRKGA